MLKYCIKFAAYLFVAIGVLSASAGSFEDFFRAIHRDDPDAILALLARGFDANASDEQGRKALHLALQLDATRAAEVLIAWKPTRIDERNAMAETPLMLAALRGQLSLAKALLARDADVNMPGWAPLHYAAASGQEALVSLLLEHHAYIDAESPNGTTPLMMAAQYGSSDSLRTLLDAGAAPELKNQLGLSALDFAQRGQRPDHVDLLQKALAKQTSP